LDLFSRRSTNSDYHWIIERMSLNEHLIDLPRPVTFIIVISEIENLFEFVKIPSNYPNF